MSRLVHPRAATDRHRTRRPPSETHRRRPPSKHARRDRTAAPHGAARRTSCRSFRHMPLHCSARPQSAVLDQEGHPYGTPHVPDRIHVRRRRRRPDRHRRTRAGRPVPEPARRCPRHRSPLHRQPRPAAAGAVPAAAARQHHPEGLAAHPTRPPTRRPERAHARDVRLPGRRDQRVVRPGAGRLGGTPLLAQRVRRPGLRHPGQPYPRTHPHLDRPHPRHPAARRLLRPRRPAHLPQRRPRLLAPHAGPGRAAHLARVQRRRPRRTGADRLVEVPPRPARHTLRAGLGLGTRRRHHRHRLLALQPHRRRLAAGPGPHDARPQRRLHPHDPDLAQRQSRPGLPRTRTVRRAGRRPLVPRGHAPGLRHRHGRLRAVPRRWLRRGRERTPRLPRPAPGFRDVRNRRVHAQPPDTHPYHR
ncbi:hypothetical protein SGPA1_40212 [Streptomyces misionensis JCM 4497]